MDVLFIGRTPSTGRLFTGPLLYLSQMEKRKRIKVFVRVRQGDIVCICLRSHRLCNDATCLRDVVEYDQYQHLRECFKNKTE